VIVVFTIAVAAIVAYRIGSAIDRRRRARRLVDAYVDGQLAARRQMAAAPEPVLAPARALPPQPGSVEAVLAHADAILKGHRS